MIGAAQAHARLGGRGLYKEFADMPHPLPLLAAVAAAPLLGLAVHAASTPAAGSPAVHTAAVLPHNLCASCHGSGRVASFDRVLGKNDLVAARTYLQGLPQG